MSKKSKSIAIPADNRKPNRNRILLPEYEFQESKQKYLDMAVIVKYQGNPVHKIHPGNFGLKPPCYPESGHMKCDHHGNIHTQEESLALLKLGLEKGFVDKRMMEGWPAHVWAVNNGTVFEAKYSRHSCYHGYPAQQNDPLASRIMRLWSQSDGR